MSPHPQGPGHEWLGSYEKVADNGGAATEYWLLGRESGVFVCEDLKPPGLLVRLYRDERRL
jgi:hypothetical protein